jgi:hypothetical protein
MEAAVEEKLAISFELSAFSKDPTPIALPFLTILLPVGFG